MTSRPLRPRAPARLALVAVLSFTTGCGAHFVQNLNDAPPPDFARVGWYAEMADLAYKPDSAARRAYPDSLYRLEIVALPHVDGRVLVVTDTARRTHYVSARGTANLENVLLDAEYSKRLDDSAGVYLHRGFEVSARAAYDTVRHLLTPGYRVNLTGHSLGGAMAAILMMYASEDGYEIGEVVTFGQPKVTDERGVRRYAAFPVLRVVDCRDPVPLVPPLTLLSAVHGPYRHFGWELILLGGAPYAFLREHDAERFAVTSFWESLPHVELGDHHMGNYVARITEKLKGAERVQYDDRNRYGCRPVPHPPVPAPAP